MAQHRITTIVPIVMRVLAASGPCQGHSVRTLPWDMTDSTSDPCYPSQHRSMARPRLADDIAVFRRRLHWLSKVVCTANPCPYGDPPPQHNSWVRPPPKIVDFRRRLHGISEVVCTTIPSPLGDPPPQHNSWVRPPPKIVDFRRRLHGISEVVCTTIPSPLGDRLSNASSRDFCRD